MRTIPTDEIRKNLSYYERLLILSEIANMSPVDISEHMDAPDAKSPSRIRSDIKRLKQTIDESSLPEGTADTFNDIIGMRNQLENGPRSTATTSAHPDGLSTDQRQVIEERVDFSLEADQELGFETDEALEWFYRRLYTARLKHKPV